MPKGGGEESREEAALIGALYAQHQNALNIARMAQASEALATEARDWAAKLESNVANQENAMHLLHENMQAKDRELASVLQRNRELQSEFEQLSATYADRYADERSMYETQLVELRQRLMDLQAKFNSLSAFSENKDDMERQLASYQAELLSEQQEHDKKIGGMEKKNASDREALNGEMLRRIKETKLTLLAMTQDTLHPTTKRTQQENEQMTTELAYQSRECEKLLQKNRALRRDNARMQTEIKQKVESERLLATRTHFFQKLIKKLREKIAAGNFAVSEYHQQLAAFQSAHGAGKGGAAQLAPRLFASEELIKSLHLRCQEMGAAFRAAQARLDALEAELSHCRDIHDVLLSSQDAVTTLTLTCLEDAKLKAVADRASRAPPNATAATSASSIALDDLNSDERRRVVQQLVRRLANFQGAHRIGLFDDLLVSSAGDAGAAEGAQLEPVELAYAPVTILPDHAGSRPTTVEAARPAAAASASAMRPSSQPPTPGRSTAAPSRADASRQSASRVSDARMPPTPAVRPPASPVPASFGATGGSTAWDHARVPDALAEKLARVQGPLRSWGQKADAAGKRH